jgi:hypothetical protein
MMVPNRDGALRLGREIVSVSKIVGVFWPTRRNPDAGPLCRLGRLVHWAALVPAALVALIAATSVSSWFDALIYFAIAIAIALLGRGLRYVMSGE